MITTIPTWELLWFQQWIEGDDVVPQVGGARRGLILHPGTRWAPESSAALPYENGPDDARPTAQQQHIIEDSLRTVLDPHVRCNIAL